MRAPKTKSEIVAAITKIENLIEKASDRLYSPKNRVPGGGNRFSGNSEDGKRVRRLENAIGKNRDKLDTLKKKLAKLPQNENTIKLKDLLYEVGRPSKAKMNLLHAIIADEGNKSDLYVSILDAVQDGRRTKIKQVLQYKKVFDKYKSLFSKIK